MNHPLRSSHTECKVRCLQESQRFQGGTRKRRLFRGRGPKWLQLLDWPRQIGSPLTRAVSTILFISVFVLLITLKLSEPIEYEITDGDGLRSERVKRSYNLSDSHNWLADCSWEKKNVPGAWGAVYAVGIIFTFVGLAIVCDDFFVPSLEAISEKLRLSEDVAGATFMAAGSSAPELFSSVAAAIQGTDVGVGTIVGSASFNILIIVALSAVLAGQVLNLDWRPLTRDSIYYSSSIFMLIFFTWDGKINPYEASIMLFMYAMYIVLMKFNSKLMAALDKPACRKYCCCNRVRPKDDPNEEQKEDTPAPVAKDEPKEVQSQVPESKPAETTSVQELNEDAERSSGATSKKGRANNMSRPTRRKGGGGSHSIVARGSVRTKEKKVDSKNAKTNSTTVGLSDTRNSYESEKANKNKNRGSGSVATGSLQKSKKHTVDRNQNRATLGSIRNSSTASGRGDDVDDAHIFHHTRKSEFSIRHLFKSETPNIQDRLDTVAENKDESVDESIPLCICCCPGVCSFCPRIKSGPPQKPKLLVEQKGCEHCLTCFKFAMRWIIYVMAFPFLFMYTLTIPDCSKESNKKYFVYSFVLSVIWIGITCFALQVMVERTGCLVGFDSFTMALLVIAVGTSIPDALSSIIVARDGFGDMAVSNALGSNVFDINLGVGLPMFIRSLIIGEPVQLLDAGEQELINSGKLLITPHVKFSFVLLCILIVWYIMITANKFVLSKRTGLCFVCLYVVFLVYAFVQDKACEKLC